jgi:choline kinase
MFDYLRQSIDQGKDSISNMVQMLTEKQQASLLEVSGHFWNDVDTPADLDYMRSLRQ